MKSSIVLALCFAVFAPLAAAYEYPLQFTPNSGARGLVVAGYYYSADTIVGNCSYYTVHSGSGRGGGYHNVTTYYNQTCTWDLYGNLLSVAQGAPAIPAPLLVSGTKTIYAAKGNGEYSGTDTNLPQQGFVFTAGSHYTWLTSNAYAVLQQKLNFFTIALRSDGDVPLHISSVDVSALVAPTAVVGTNCIGAVAIGGTCGITVAYNPKKLTSPTGLAYDTLTVGVISDAGQPSNFVQSYTIQVALPVDDGGN